MSTASYASARRPVLRAKRGLRRARPTKRTSRRPQGVPAVDHDPAGPLGLLLQPWNYYLNLGEFRQAVAGYETSIRLVLGGHESRQPVHGLCPASGTPGKRSPHWKEALKIAPDSAAANLNMGLLQAEQRDRKSAERYLRQAWKADPQMGQRP